MRRRKEPVILARKLSAIRKWKNLSQSEILRLVYPEMDEHHRALISQWENANRQPSRQILIRYAQVAEITLEELMLDDVELPTRILDAGADAAKDSESEDAEDKIEIEISANNKSDSDHCVQYRNEFTQIPVIKSDSSEEIEVKFANQTLEELGNLYLALLNLLPRNVAS